MFIDVIKKTLKIVKEQMGHVIKLYLSQDEFVKNLCDKESLSKEKKLFVMQTPLHGNLGDQAIAFAQKKFLMINFPDYHYVEIPKKNVVSGYKYIKKIIQKKDIIFIVGGGNMGNLYLTEEKARRFIVKKFKGYNIISFPQSAYFENSIKGKKELMKSQKCYSENSCFYLVAREMITFNFMKEKFNFNKVIMTPDIVLSLDERVNMKRNGIITMIRSDKESNLSKKFRMELFSKLELEFGKIKISDTHIGDSLIISESNRKSILQQKWNELRTSELLVTDRLHGMIFAAITGTPCIVIQNSNHKIISTYNSWIRNKNIELINDLDVEKLMKAIRRLKFNANEYVDYNEDYKPLINLIKSL